MEQKIYDYEIMLNLLKGGNHLRQIAKDIGANHMTAKRALDRLVKENALDVKRIGKNNMFSIKNTLEAMNLLNISELYRFSNFIRKHPELKREIKELKKLPVEIIAIFGSYAKGAENAKSDIDVYMDTGNRGIKEKASGLNSKFSVKIGAFDRKSLLIKEIEKSHIIVKGVEKFYEKNQFFDQA